jgi:hypothetical protein
MCTVAHCVHAEPRVLISTVRAEGSNCQHAELMMCVCWCWRMLCAGGKSGEIIPHKLFAMAGTGYISAMVCSIEALKYVNFPTKELGKSCKVISAVTNLFVS